VTPAHRLATPPARILLGISLIMIGLLIAITSMRLAPTVRAADEAVDISGFQFQPASITVQVGDTVTWTNSDSTAHTVTSTTGAPEAFDSGNLTQGDTFSFAFMQAGTYPYRCEIHTSMTGEVVVQAAAGGASASPSAAQQTAAPTRASSQLPDGATERADSDGGIGWLGVLGVLLLTLGLGEPLLAWVRGRRA
jgi:plastocyanin